jgi:HPt (histidine-containing phosphotransfer) domain-containing protein
MCHKIIKLDYLYEMGGDDVSFIVEMIDLFVVQSDEIIGDINKHLQNDDLENLKKTLHKLKSSANLFQITELVDIIIDFESKQAFSKVALSALVKDIVNIVLTAKEQLVVEKALLVK